MDNIYIIITTALGSSAVLYALQSFFPTLSVKTESKLAQAQVAQSEGSLFFELAEKYKSLAEECSKRETDYLEIIAENQDQIRALQRERTELVEALRRSNNLVDDLRSRLDLEKRSTKTFDYIALIADVYALAEEDDSFVIMNRIKDYAQNRSRLRDAISKTDHGSVGKA